MVTMGLFESGLWGDSIELTPVPKFIYSVGGKPLVSELELRVLSVASEESKKAKANCRFTMPAREMAQRVGYKKEDRVADALRGLLDKNFFGLVGNVQHRQTRTFEFCDLRTGEGLSSLSTNRSKWRSLRRVLNDERIPYLWAPSDSIRSLAHQDYRFHFSLSVAAFATAGRLAQRSFEVSAGELRTMCGLDPDTFTNAVWASDEPWFTIGFTDNRHRSVYVRLMDAASGQSLDDVEDSRKTSEQQQREQRYAEDTERTDQHTNVKLMALALWAVGDLEQNDRHGEFVKLCPFCRNAKKNRPRFSINVFKGTHGFWRCPECKAGGDLRRLVQKLTGLNLLQVQQKLASMPSDNPQLMARAERLLRGFTADGRYKAA
jgi:hypothetical protein